MPHPRRPRALSWPLLLLVFSLSVMLGTAWKAHQLQRQRQQTAEQLLRDYAAFGAWSFQRQLAIQLEETTWQVVNPIMHREVHMPERFPDATSLARYRAQSLIDCRCDSTTRPASYFSYILGADTMMVVGGQLASGARRDILARLSRWLEPRESESRPRSGVIGPSREVPSLVGYGLMPTARMDTVVYGFVVDRASLTPTFRMLLGRRDLLPEAVSHGRPGDSLLALEVLDRDGGLLYRDPRWPSHGLVAEERLPEGRAGLMVRMAVLPEAAESLVAGGLSGNELPVLLAVVGLAVLLAVVAVAQLRREQQLARLRSDFVASVSHELRTPLAQIRLFLDTLRLGRYQTDDQRDWLVGHLARETTRLEQLVDNVLHFSRMERQGDSRLALECSEVASLVRETADSFTPLAQSRRVRLELDVAASAEVLVDPARFRQVLLNLLDNAVKFGPVGQTVRLRLAREGDVVRLRVEDQGPGVPEEERAIIWDAYVRGAGARQAAAGGSGIGLAIVRDAVRGMAGRAWVEEAPGGGAAFVLELPVAPAAVEAPTPVPVETL